MTLKALREGIATNLQAITGLHVLPFVPDNPTPPMAVVIPSTIAYDTAMARGTDEYRFEVTVIVARASERGAQDVLDSYCNPAGSTSIKKAIEADKTLGGAAQAIRVTDLSSYGPLTVGDVTYLAATFTVQALASGTT